MCFYCRRKSAIWLKNAENSLKYCPDGGTGRRAGLKILLG